MKLNLIDKLTLLALDDDKGTFITAPLYFTYGIAGAIILELTLKNKIEIVDKKVIVKSRRAVGEPLLDLFLNKIIQSKKQRSLSHWIQSFGNKERDIKKETLKKLMTHGILTKREDKILWVIPNTKYPTKNVIPENELKRRLSAIVDGQIKPELEDIMLLSLVDTCNLIRGVFGKENTKLYKKNIKTLVESTLDSKSISATVKEVHELVVTMIVVLMSTTVIVTAN